MRGELAGTPEARSRAKGTSQASAVQVLIFKVLLTLHSFLHLITIYIHKTVLVSPVSTVLPSPWEGLVRPMPAFQFGGELYMRDQDWGQKAEQGLQGLEGEWGVAVTGYGVSFLKCGALSKFSLESPLSQLEKESVVNTCFAGLLQG